MHAHFGIASGAQWSRSLLWLTILEFEGRLVHVGTFPIGIDPEKFIRGLEEPTILDRISRLKEKFKGLKLIVGVDRLDYIKGVPQKLHGKSFLIN